MTNTRRSVVVGDHWEFHDPEEGWVEWRVDKLNEDGTGSLRKLTGRDQGFPAHSYPVKQMPEARRWRWKSGTAEPEVTFSCPHCGEDKAIPEGDYVCNECRVALDADD